MEKAWTTISSSESSRHLEAARLMYHEGALPRTGDSIHSRRPSRSFVVSSRNVTAEATRMDAQAPVSQG